MESENRNSEELDFSFKCPSCNKGKIKISEDFDKLPPEISSAFGMD